MTAPALPPSLQHYLASGCWAAPAASREESLELFLLSGAVLRGDLAGLRRAWADCGPRVKATHPAPTFAEEMLAGRLHPFDTATWPQHFGRVQCRAHPVMKRGEQAVHPPTRR
jgi:hypothetical protein